MSRASLALAAAVACLPPAANAGPLLSATLEHSFRVGGDGLAVSVRVDALSPAGTLVGSQFMLDEGSAFAAPRTFVRGTPTPGGGTLAFTLPVTRATIAFGRNGELVGDIAGSRVSPATGITGFVRLRAKIGKAPSFTLIRVPHSVGARYTTLAPPTSLRTTPTTVAVTQWGDGWHLGRVVATGLTTGTVPGRPGGPVPDEQATGGVTFTPDGGTRITLVSLSRIRVRGVANFTDVNVARLTLLYAPEPASAALLLAGAASGALALAKARAWGRMAT